MTGLHSLRLLKRATLQFMADRRAFKRGQKAPSDTARDNAVAATPVAANPLRDYCNSISQGPGLWKWDHYLDIYHELFSKFRGTDVHILEIGIYSGGSLKMWREYFGEKATIYGVDIEESCRAYEGDKTHIFIGDQADRSFWRDFKSKAPRIDILIDDGGHTYEQQAVTLEEMLPHISPGGVFLCEDLYRDQNTFHSLAFGMSKRLHSLDEAVDWNDPSSKTNDIQSAIASVKIYPYVTAIEKRPSPLAMLRSPKRGTQWQPFYS